MSLWYAAGSAGAFGSAAAPEPRHAVRVVEYLPSDDSHPRQPEREDVEELRSCDEHEQEADGRYDHHGAEVRLQDDRPGYQPDDQRRQERPSHEQLDTPCREVKPHRDQEHGGELCELPRLEVERPEGDPPVGALDGLEQEDRQQGDEDDEAEHGGERPVVPPYPVVDKRKHHRDGHAHREVHSLSLHEVELVVVRAAALDLARAEENDKAQSHENRDDQAK